MSERKENHMDLENSRFGVPPVFGAPVFPRDSSEYPVLVFCDADRAVVAINRKTGYLLYREVLPNRNWRILTGWKSGMGWLFHRGSGGGRWRRLISDPGRRIEKYRRASLKS